MRYIILLLFAIVVSVIVAQSNGPWVAPKSADELKSPLKDKKSAAKDGQALFVQYCVPCHGNEGYGNGVSSVNLNPKPANLTSKPVQEQKDGAIFWKISNGRGQMVAWQYTLSEKQRWELVDYIRTLAKK